MDSRQNAMFATSEAAAMLIRTAIQMKVDTPVWIEPIGVRVADGYVPMYQISTWDSVGYLLDLFSDTELSYIDSLVEFSQGKN